MQNLKMIYKLGLGFGAILLVILATGIVNTAYLGVIRQGNREIVERYTPALQTANRITRSFARANALFLLFAAQHNPAVYTQAMAEIENTDKELRAGRRLADSDRNLENLARDLAVIAKLLREYRESNRQLRGRYSDARHNAIVKQGQRIIAVTDKITTAAIADIARGGKTALNSVHNLTFALYAGIALALALGLAITLFLARRITRPLNRSKDFAETLAEGDFREKLEIRQQDEIGELAVSMNRIVENTGTMIKGITEGMNTLAASSTELSTIAEQMAASAGQTSGRSETVAAAAEEMSANMNSVAAAVEEATTNLGVVATATSEMSSAVGEIAQNTSRASTITDTAVKAVQAASGRIDELGQAADEIGKVTEAISGISDQTNLLALNATIEAARAGEAGKGFAVVANEIKELAKQTVEATNEIHSRIAGIQDSARSTVTEIGDISAVISEVSTIVTTIAAAVEEQTATTREIAANMQQANLGLQEITKNVSQSSTVSAEIAREIVEVSQAAREMATAGSQVRESVTDLSRLAEKLNHLASAFRF